MVLSLELIAAKALGGLVQQKMLKAMSAFCGAFIWRCTWAMPRRDFAEGRASGQGWAATNTPAVGWTGALGLSHGSQDLVSSHSVLCRGLHSFSSHARHRCAWEKRIARARVSMTPLVTTEPSSSKQRIHFSMFQVFSSTQQWSY